MLEHLKKKTHVSISVRDVERRVKEINKVFISHTRENNLISLMKQHSNTELLTFTVLKIIQSELSRNEKYH